MFNMIWCILYSTMWCAMVDMSWCVIYNAMRYTIDRIMWLWKVIDMLCIVCMYMSCIVRCDVCDVYFDNDYVGYRKASCAMYNMMWCAMYDVLWCATVSYDVQCIILRTWHGYLQRLIRGDVVCNGWCVVMCNCVIRWII